MFLHGGVAYLHESARKRKKSVCTTQQLLYLDQEGPEILLILKYDYDEVDQKYF
jgi:hypothetical protein